MQNEIIDILVTFDESYIVPFRTMLKSLVVNNPRENVHIWLLHSAVSQEALSRLEEDCASQNVGFTGIQVDRTLFKNAPITKQYPQEMYYRLLAPQILPKSLKKVLYLDPDILVINPLRPLWEMELGDFAFAAASHTGVTEMMNDVNRVRLGTDHDYYNSGVMLMDLEKGRELVKPDEIFDCVREHGAELILPDQDVFNFLYGAYTMPIPDEIWNYDVRDYNTHMLTSQGAHDLEWVIRNTVILHFCGKKKPWKTMYPRRFIMLYRHYMAMADRQRIDTNQK